MNWFYYESHNLGVSDCSLNKIFNFLKDKNIPFSFITVKSVNEFGMKDYIPEDELLDAIYFYYQGE